MTRAEAIAAGRKTYLGVPCLRGHDGWRYVGNEGCRACGLARAAAWGKANPERRLSITRKWTAENPEYERAKIGKWAKANPAGSAAQEARRRARKMRATPMWADHTAIVAVYREAARLTAETGVLHHVDHIIPLAGRNVCGLHVHHNLRAIPAQENWSKNNKLMEIAA